MAAAAPLLLAGLFQVPSMMASQEAAKNKRMAGKIRADESETEARSIELAATSREADRKERLAKSLSSQIARSGAAGVAAFQGSPLTVIKDSIESERRGTERDVFQSELSSMTTRSRGRTSRRIANMNARQGLLTAQARSLQVIGSQAG